MVPCPGAAAWCREGPTRALKLSGGSSANQVGVGPGPFFGGEVPASVPGAGGGDRAASSAVCAARAALRRSCHASSGSWTPARYPATNCGPTPRASAVRAWPQRAVHNTPDPAPTSRRVDHLPRRRWTGTRRHGRSAPCGGEAPPRGRAPCSWWLSAAPHAWAHVPSGVSLAGPVPEAQRAPHRFARGPRAAWRARPLGSRGRGRGPCKRSTTSLGTPGRRHRCLPG